MEGWGRWNHRRRGRLLFGIAIRMSTGATLLKDGDRCAVVTGTHKGKSGIVRDLNMSKTGHLTITVVQANGERFKTLGRNVVKTG